MLSWAIWAKAKLIAINLFIFEHFFLSRQKFYFFIAFTDLRVISKLLRYQICPLKGKQEKKLAFPFLKTRSFNFMPFVNNLNQKVRTIYDEFGLLSIRIKKVISVLRALNWSICCKALPFWRFHLVVSIEYVKC